jgi:hypothetical protein
MVRTCRGVLYKLSYSLLVILSGTTSGVEGIYQDG